jgi:hypothetical protein
MQLPSPAQYIPLEKGVYEVAPGLYPLGYDFGHGAFDSKVIQLDQDYPRYRENKLECRRENLAKYYCRSELAPSVEQRVVEFLLARLTQEWPEFFQITNAANTRVLSCTLTGEKLEFSNDGVLLGKSQYRDAIDALVSQLQEDLAIVSEDGARDWLSLLHVCGPSHWAPSQKVGLNFDATHAPIPGVEKMARASRALVQAMIHKGPYVRFVWSFVTDQQINHHPEAPEGKDPLVWRGRAFQGELSTPFYLRVERQVTFGLPDVNAAMFFIRVSFVDDNQIKAHPEWRRKLVTSLESMSAASRKYKGVDQCFDELVDWLQK